MADKGKVNYDTFIMRHGLYRNLPKGKLGEPLYCTDTHELYIGQGEDKAPIPVVAQGGSGTDVNGMFFSVDTIADRDALKYTHNIQNGAMCYVASEDMYYKYSNGEWGEANFGTGGGGTTGSLTSDMAEDLTLSVNSDLQISYFFSSPNAGKGNLKVFIDGVEAVSESVSQGAGVVTVLESKFTKGKTHTLVMYVVDRAEIFTNSLTFYVTYGGLEISTTFDSASSYDVGSIIRCYYTPTSVKTLPIKLYVKIDGELQEPVNCTANTRNTYTFPRTLDAGSHNIQMWVEDADGMSNVLMFALILLSSDSLVITSSKTDVEAEEGDQVSLDYKVSMKNQTAFNTKYYIDEVLLQSGTCGVVKTAWNTSTLTKGTHKLMLYVETQAKGEDGVTPLATATYTWNVVIVESSYQIIKHNTAGLVAGFTAKDRVNTANDKEYWVGTDEDGNEVIAELFNYGYDNTCGWVDNSLMSNGKAYTKIPVRPLATNGGKQGVTVEIEFSAKDIGVEDAVILDCYDTTKDCGIKITKDRAIMKSFSGNSLNLDYSEQTNTHIVLVLDRLNKMAKGYINGVLCEAFYLSDTGEGDGAVLEDFAVDKDTYINALCDMRDGTVSNIGWSKVKNVRFYNIALTSEEVIQNYLANITDKDAQRLKSQFQRGSTLPTMTFTGSTKGMSKDNAVSMKITYNSTDELLYGKSFELKNCSVSWQGTSSLQYVVKNYKIKLKDDSGNKFKYNPYGETNALPESTFCLKADYMESSHANNTGLAKFITKYLYEGDTIDYCPPRQSYTGVRDTITGFPIRLIINDVQDNGETITKDMGIFNFNLDKGCTDSFGLDTEKYPNCMSYEVVANSDTSAGAFFSYGYRIDDNTTAGSEFDTELEYLQNSFELRYPDDKVVGSDYGYLSNLKRVIDWVCSMPVDTDEQKKAFRDQFPNYFDKGYTLRYLLCVLVFGMVDNLGKNMMLDTWDGQIWYPRFYDLDTSFGLDNSGVLRFGSDIEIKVGTFNTSNSQLWSKVMIAFENELRTEYQYMRSGKFNVENIMEFMYGEQISKIPESYYNSDAQTKYLDFGALYLSKLHGNRYEHMKRWIRRRLLYVDTLLNYTSTTDDSITVRAGTLQLIQFQLETFEPQYVRIKWKNGETRKYRCDGKTPTICEYKLDTETDQEILIYNASNLKRLGGLSSAVPESMDLANAVRLSELEVHSTKLKNINGTTSGGVNVSSMSNLNRINLSGCTALEGALNVAGCTMLQYIDIKETIMSDVQLPPTGAALEEIWYSDNIQTISLSNAPNLKILGLSTSSSCKSLILKDCPNIETFGDRKWDATKEKYNYHANYFLGTVENIVLDNSVNVEELYLPRTDGIQSITLKNNTKTKLITMSGNYLSNVDIFNYKNVIWTDRDTLNNFTLVNDANTPLQELRFISGICRNYAYTNLVEYRNTDYEISPKWLVDNSAYNTVDLTGSTIKNFMIYTQAFMLNVKLPTGLKKLYANTLDKEAIGIEHWSNKTFDDVEPFMYRATDVKTLMDGQNRRIGGCFIGNISNPLSPGSTGELTFVHDFTGMELDFIQLHKFRILNQGLDIGDYTMELHNLNHKFVNESQPLPSYNLVDDCVLDYSEFNGESIIHLAYRVDTENYNVTYTPPNKSLYDKPFANGLTHRAFFYSNIPSMEWKDVQSLLNKQYYRSNSAWNAYDSLGSDLSFYDTKFKEQTSMTDAVNVSLGRTGVHGGVWGYFGKNSNLQYIDTLIFTDDYYQTGDNWHHTQCLGMQNGDGSSTFPSYVNKLILRGEGLGSAYQGVLNIFNKSVAVKEIYDETPKIQTFSGMLQYIGCTLGFNDTIIIHGNADNVYGTATDSFNGKGFTNIILNNINIQGNCERTFLNTNRLNNLTLNNSTIVSSVCIDMFNGSSLSEIPPITLDGNLQSCFRSMPNLVSVENVTIGSSVSNVNWTFTNTKSPNPYVKGFYKGLSQDSHGNYILPKSITGYQDWGAYVYFDKSYVNDPDCLTDIPRISVYLPTTGTLTFDNNGKSIPRIINTKNVSRITINVTTEEEGTYDLPTIRPNGSTPCDIVVNNVGNVTAPKFGIIPNLNNSTDYPLLTLTFNGFDNIETNNNPSSSTFKPYDSYFRNNNLHTVNNLPLQLLGLTDTQIVNNNGLFAHDYWNRVINLTCVGTLTESYKFAGGMWDGVMHPVTTESLNNLIAHLGTVENKTLRITGSWRVNLTDDMIATITSKGWNVTG